MLKKSIPILISALLPLSVNAQECDELCDNEFMQVASPSVVMQLIDAGATANGWIQDGVTPLHWAVWPKHVSYDLVKAVIEAGAYVDEPDDMGNTALVTVLEMDPFHEDVARLILDTGYDVAIEPNADGETPYEIAVRNKDRIPQSFIDLLPQTEENVEVKCTALYISAKTRESCEEMKTFESGCEEHSLVSSAYSFLRENCSEGEAEIQPYIEPTQDTHDQTGISPLDPLERYRKIQPTADEKEAKRAELEREKHDLYSAAEIKCMNYAAAPAETVHFAGVHWNDINSFLATNYCLEAIKSEPTIRSETAAAAARAFSKHKDYETAEELAFLALKASTGNAAAMGFISSLYGKKDYRGYDEQESFEWLEKAANAGSPMYIYNLAWHYLNGAGQVEKNIATAYRYYEQAADRGYADAQMKVGNFYRTGGDHFPQNSFKAVANYSRASEQGHPDGYHRIGEMYRYGMGVDIDYRRAFDMFMFSARMGGIQANHDVADMYWRGEWVARDREFAKRHWEEAARKGHMESQRKYARLLHEDGEGQAAFEWYTKAAEQGDQVSQDQLDQFFTK